MKTFDVADWLVAPFVAQGVTKSDFFLYGAGRALAFVRMAAYALGEIPDDQKVAEYHAYTGISAARTAVDAIASWCNATLKLGVKPGNQINLSREDYRKKVLQCRPEVEKYAKHLGDLGKKIDEHRQRAQHREGLAIRIKFSRKSECLNGWYLAPEGLNGDQSFDLRLVDLLDGWAEEIEHSLRAIHNMVIASNGTQETGLKTQG